MTGPGRTAEGLPLRLLLIADPGNAHTRNWASHLSDLGHRVTVAGFRHAEIPGVSVESVFSDSREQYNWPGLGGALRLRRKLRKLVRRLTPDLVHLHQIPVHAAGWFLFAPLQPLVITVWGSDILWEPPSAEPRRVRCYKSWLLRQGTIHTAASHHLARRTERYLTGTPVRVVPFGVDLTRFSPGNTRREGPLVLGFLKHLESRYGADLLLRALSELPDARAEIAGTGSLEESLRAQAESLGVSERVRFHGAVPYDSVPTFLQKIDVLVMPSRSESFGVAALEAAACGRPVVATRVGGVAEVVRDGETGRLVPPDDPVSIAAAIRSLSDPDLRAQMGSAGRRHVERSFSMKHCLDRMTEAYRDALA